MVRAAVRSTPPNRLSAPPSAVRAYIEEHRQELHGMLASPRHAGLTLSARHAQLMDALVRQLFEGAAACNPEVPRDAVVLAAVGGYGRQQLGWQSDLDIRFITRKPQRTIGRFVDAVLYPLWDAGVSVGHQVVCIADAVGAARDDLPTATALLELRVLAGDAAIARDLSERASRELFDAKHLPRFLDALEAQTEARHLRYGDSVYLLEPDVKNGSGGLRDVDVALWAARARFRSGDLATLERDGVLASRQVEPLRQAIDFLWAVRNHLHARAGRRSDRLTFAEQEAVAALLRDPTGASVAADSGDDGRLHATVEGFMSDYYRHARTVVQVREQVLGRVRRQAARPARVLDLGDGLVKCGDGVGLREPAALHDDPALALRLVAVAVGADAPLLSHSREAIADATGAPEFCRKLRDSPDAASLFVGLVCTSRSVRFAGNSILRELHDLGLLLAMIPEFAPVVGRVHHDMYHVYTVDVHSIAAVDRLRALVRGDSAGAHGQASRIASELVGVRSLFMATLLHDVGKVIGGRDHARRGAHMARPILERLGLAPTEVDSACRLVANHLVMYLMSVQRDITDPATLDELLREVGDAEGLRALYLLTVADLATTSPTSLTRWNASMLDALLREAEIRLASHPTERHQRLERARQQVRAVWGSRATAGAIDAYLDTMPERYLCATPPEIVVEHAVLALTAGADPVSASLVPSPHPGVAQLCVVADTRAAGSLCVVAPDQPGLLASIAAAISANGLEIHAAEVHTRALADGGEQAVDVFWVRSVRGVEGVVERLPRLQQDLRQAVVGKVRPAELLRRAVSALRRDRGAPSVATEVVLDHRACASHTVVEVVTADRPGLLFTLAQALHEIGISIHLAKINTEGARVTDVFYVTDLDGHKLAEGPDSERVAAALHAALEQRSQVASPAGASLSAPPPS